MTVFNQPAHKRPENLTIDSPEPVEPGCLPPSRDHMKVPSAQGSRKQKKSSKDCHQQCRWGVLAQAGGSVLVASGAQRSHFSSSGASWELCTGPSPSWGPPFPLISIPPPLEHPHPGRSTSASSSSTCSHLSSYVSVCRCNPRGWGPSGQVPAWLLCLWSSNKRDVRVALAEPHPPPASRQSEKQRGKIVPLIPLWFFL